jgi:hypothetical protein
MAKITSSQCSPFVWLYFSGPCSVRQNQEISRLRKKKIPLPFSGLLLSLPQKPKATLKVPDAAVSRWISLCSWVPQGLYEADMMVMKWK